MSPYRYFKAISVEEPKSEELEKTEDGSHQETPFRQFLKVSALKPSFPHLSFNTS